MNEKILVKFDWLKCQSLISRETLKLHKAPQICEGPKICEGAYETKEMKNHEIFQGI